MTPTSVHTKIVASVEEAIGTIDDDAVLLVGGWGGIGVPERLIRAVSGMSVRGLQIVTNNCGMGRPGDVGEIFAAGLVSRVTATFPANPKATAFRER